MPDERPPVEVRVDRIDTRKLRTVRDILEQVSRGIHSDGRMLHADKIKHLSRLAHGKKILDAVLQVELFTPDQLL